MHNYCLDTSGISSLLVDMPETIYVSLWGKVISLIHAKVFCWNGEIAAELALIGGRVGQALASVNSDCLYEVNQGNWQSQSYLALTGQWTIKYNQYISEYNNNRKDTIGMSDLSIVALAKILGKPLVSMEKPNFHPSTKRMRIPELCRREQVKHLNFNEFLMAEGLTI